MRDEPSTSVTLDLDGVVYLGNEPVPGAAASLNRLRWVADATAERDGPAIR